MTKDEALAILQEMQKWRRGEAPYDGDKPQQMPYTPKQFGEAIDYALGYVKVKEGTEPFHTRHYRTEWKDIDNVVISLYESGNDFQIGIIEVRIEKEKRNAYIWNLHVSDTYRGKGYGRYLLRDAIDVAMCADCKTVSLEWEEKDTPYWVLEWYSREGFNEKEFGKGCSLLEKVIEINK